MTTGTPRLCVPITVLERPKEPADYSGVVAVALVVLCLTVSAAAVCVVFAMIAKRVWNWIAHKETPNADD